MHSGSGTPPAPSCRVFQSCVSCAAAWCMQPPASKTTMQHAISKNAVVESCRFCNIGLPSGCFANTPSIEFPHKKDELSLPPDLYRPARQNEQRSDLLTQTKTKPLRSDTP